MGWVAGVDVGGTFTDILLAETETGRRLRHKVPSLPRDPARAILAGVGELAERGAIPTAAIVRLAHGTTAATNALIERRGGAVALVTTLGFRDVLEIGRQTRPKLYDFRADHPEPLVPRERRLEARERIGPAGEVLLALTEDEIARVVDAVAHTGCTSVAVGLLFSFANPEHERRIGAALRRALPDRAVSLSCEIQPEFREYERISTTVLNAFLQPTIGPYVARVETSLGEAAPGARLDICQSSGGLMSASRAAAMPIRTVLSGPAAGVIGAVAIAARAGQRNAITFDMGGTSTDVCLVRDGVAETSHGHVVAGFPVRLPAVDIHTVGAGGGSIAHIGRDGLLKVGPISAGAEPGPACYGRGGREPTVSDANVVLGRLPDTLIGGGMRLDVTQAEAAVAGLGRQLGLSMIATALGIVRIVNSNMVRAIRAVSVERGWDPRGFTLMPFGGAGPLHAVEVAREIGIATILVPPAPGILCAEGVAVAELEESFVATARTPLLGDLAAVRAAVERLRADAAAWFARNGIGQARQASQLTFDMRYIGQNYELPLPVPLADALDEVPTLGEAFHRVHRTRYGHSDPGAAIEIVNVRLVVRAGFAPLPSDSAGAAPAQMRTGKPSLREVWFDDEAPRSVPTIERDLLAAGARIEGPVVVTQFDATTLLPPGCRATVEPCSSLLIEIEP
jgi:N-methylhydantoinase A